MKIILPKMTSENINDTRILQRELFVLSKILVKWWRIHDINWKNYITHDTCLSKYWCNWTKKSIKCLTKNLSNEDKINVQSQAVYQINCQETIDLLITNKRLAEEMKCVLQLRLYFGLLYLYPKQIQTKIKAFCM